MSAIAKPLTTLALAALALFGLQQSAAAQWMAGRGNDASGLVYLAVINDAETGERIELNCTPAGQTFLAVSWNATAQPPGTERLSLRFLIDGSHRFAAAARFRTLDRGRGAAELDTPDTIRPLTEALAVSSGSLEVEIASAGIVIMRSEFDMAEAPQNIGLYRSYCHL